MTPDEIMNAFDAWLRTQMEDDYGPKATWPKRVRDRFYTKIGEMVHFTGSLKIRHPNILGPAPCGPISWPEAPIQATPHDPCAGCGPICGNAGCPKRLVVTCKA